MLKKLIANKRVQFSKINKRFTYWKEAEPGNKKELKITIENIAPEKDNIKENVNNLINKMIYELENQINNPIEYENRIMISKKEQLKITIEPINNNDETITESCICCIID